MYATAGSLILHAVLIAAFLIRHGGGGVGQNGGQFDRGESGPAPGVAAISVSLVEATLSMQNSSLTAPEPKLIDPLQSLMIKALSRATPAAAPPTPPKPTSLDSLIAAADRAAKPSSAKDGKGGPAQGAEAATAPGQTGVPGSGAAAAAGDLYAQVEPCWRRALGASTVPVTLEVALDRNGRIAAAPKAAVNGAATDSEARRVAVERALQAVAACLPYRNGSGGNLSGVYRVAFGVSGR